MTEKKYNLSTMGQQGIQKNQVATRKSMDTVYALDVRSSYYSKNPMSEVSFSNKNYVKEPDAPPPQGPAPQKDEQKGGLARGPDWQTSNKGPSPGNRQRGLGRPGGGAPI
jgi:hypothetical protein